MHSAIDNIAKDLKKKLEEKNEQFLFGVEKFVGRYMKMKNSISLLTSSLHRFGWTFGGSVSNRKNGHLRHGRRIAVQATAAGRRKSSKSRGKAKAVPGKPAGVQKPCGASSNVNSISRYCMPTRRSLKGRRLHSQHRKGTTECWKMVTLTLVFKCAL